MTAEPGALDEDLHPIASVIFGDRLGLAERYAVALATSGVVRGLIGPREVDRIWERHLLNCAVLAELVEDGSTVVDVGSGAGLPGIPLALAKPSLTVHLVEPLLRRTQWLDEVLAELRLPNVVVERARAEDSKLAGSADVVTSRAVAPLERFVPMAAPLLKESGVVLALKGRSASEELGAAAGQLERFGVQGPDVVLCGRGLLEEPTTVVRLPIPRRPAQIGGGLTPAGAPVARAGTAAVAPGARSRRRSRGRR